MLVYLPGVTMASGSLVASKQERTKGWAWEAGVNAVKPAEEARRRDQQLGSRGGMPEPREPGPGLRSSSGAEEVCWERADHQLVKKKWKAWADF